MCNCASPYEHAQHLMREKEIQRKLHPEPIIYLIFLEDGTEVEVSKEEFMASFDKGGISQGTRDLA